MVRKLSKELYGQRPSKEMNNERRGLEILQAMIMAARADGHVDANERALLTREIYVVSAVMIAGRAATANR